MTKKMIPANDENTLAAFKKIVELPASTYVNTTPVMRLGGVDLMMWDVVKAALAARLNTGLGGGSGGGKSQLFADVSGLFGNDVTYVLGRNGTDIVDFYRQFKFGKLKEAMDKGGDVSQHDIIGVTSRLRRPITLVEEINRAAEIVQNQYFNVFEGFVEVGGDKFPLGAGKLTTYKDYDGSEIVRSTHYSVGLWTANFGNGEYGGTVSMDKGLKERSHMIIDVDNFYPGRVNPSDLDHILLKSAGEVRLKDSEGAENRTQHFSDAFNALGQIGLTPNPEIFGEELFLFRYLIMGLDYVPIPEAKNSKRMLKEVWPQKVEEQKFDQSVSNDQKALYKIVFPASTRSALTMIALARSLRAYTVAMDPKASPPVIDSVIEAFKLVAPYGGLINNAHIVKEEFAGNSYLAAAQTGDFLRTKLLAKVDVMQTIIGQKSKGEPLMQRQIDECTEEFACFK